MTFLQINITHTTCATHTISETSKDLVEPYPQDLLEPQQANISNIHSKSIFPYEKQS